MALIFYTSWETEFIVDFSYISKHYSGISDLKWYIHVHHGIPERQQLLVFNQQVMYDKYDIFFYGVDEGSQISLFRLYEDEDEQDYVEDEQDYVDYVDEDEAEQDYVDEDEADPGVAELTESMAVNFHTSWGTEFTIGFSYLSEYLSEIADLKLYIEVHHGIPERQQALVFNQQPMHDSNDIFFYGVKEGSQICLFTVDEDDVEQDYVEAEHDYVDEDKADPGAAELNYQLDGMAEQAEDEPEEEPIGVVE